jgi:SAM-dependent methyltransferase
MQRPADDSATLAVLVSIDEPNPVRRQADPLAGSAWSDPGTIDGFVHAAPNQALLEAAGRNRAPAARLLDIGCGAGRNAVPLARAGWPVVGTDLSLAMVQAATRRARDEGLPHRLRLLLAPMEALPFFDDTFDFIVAHGIWNLARSGREFRRAVREAARVARPGCPLFMFTFSRGTLSSTAAPVPGEAFVFTQFANQPQCFLTAVELTTELAAAGFEPDPALPLRELNQRRAGALHVGGAPVIYEGLFRRRGP